MKRTTIVNGFRACGLFPFDPKAVDYSKLEITKESAAPDVAQSQSSLPSNCCLSFLESLISETTLKEFKTTYNQFTPIWQGNEAAQDLYVAWKKAKDKVSGNLNGAPIQSNCNVLEAAENLNNEME